MDPRPFFKGGEVYILDLLLPLQDILLEEYNRCTSWTSLSALTNMSTGGHGTLNLVYYTISMMGAYEGTFKSSTDMIF